MIPSTHLSLLNALKDADQRSAAWERFQKRYQETLMRWCVRQGLQEADAEDVTQAVLTRLFRSLPEYQHDPTRSFRKFLKAVVNNAVRDVYRARHRHPADRGVGGSDFQVKLANLETSEALEELAGGMKDIIDPKLEEAVERVKSRVADVTWRAFWRQVVDGVSAADAAQELGLSVASAYQARYRVNALLAKEFPNQES